MKIRIIEGTEIKLNIHHDPIDGLTMDDYAFEVSLYCSPRKTVVVSKADLRREDENNYIVALDTAEVGSGDLKCRTTSYIPDGDFPDNLRTEIVEIDTEMTIVKRI